ncbi:UDP-N-acetylglucosamine--dolichyl-phosphate N-acetylglucosaminephosphotransferase, putative [Plasmodium chabaudi chabaudi]|uniref:UDP-N-acetylglucosamine--dolichyl-phosphate N-acetylglucosaminephosphotransferase n=1 Tax=Plasmodium chabaudi chabaudi TaxID=31271 RepID=A0A077TRX1_PLACU|nr:UDP-N-acetylglucosamine--dolichyl-phosphate N-acetylglucosaminephosphotransferase, putative [Plasmodium chabaudi chabaudi]SCM24677.1 UDP-N-acetylglucosamine--dolichyl-phosphate N-acetylglucosaminephosphotransferase, putative [Plasmodium chabaudi chabaudi]VTZ69651.1 UDP-N-acetylglucosamine--dolichyl-phosphate N-acetylglucosaminephosphotransferase, putative [Plasmodium chabaudi chabaudi]|eukprot:XP_016654241.1 N-acetylglucosamine-1-phosphate transferase, putative [Plasmodium chabaudi chabaudi]
MKSKFANDKIKADATHIYKESIPERYLFSFLIFYLLIVLYALKDTIYKNIIIFYIGPCVLLFKLSFICIPKFIQFLNQKGLCGIDLNKLSKDKVAEPIGLFPSILYFIFVLFYQILYYNDHKILLEYNAGLLSIIFMTFLGFIDDVLELKWRYKVILPFFASLPLLLCYSGETNIRIPNFLIFIFKKKIINIGFFYYIYIILLSVFCTNTINIYAGINGLEIGQTLIISIFISIHNLIEIILNIRSSDIFGLRILKQHFLSIIFTLPFISINLATFAFNFYPSKGFVGNTLTYFCGMFLAVVSIFGHYSKTLILFLVPQFLNFFLSLPQLFNFIPCPRHRLPIIDHKTNKLTHSYNFTLINLILYIFGPLSEYHLVIVLLFFQFATCSIGLFLRYFIDTT